ncbi:MAG TPA: hypothetical protein VNO70_12215, partial [Blastocatellia bacterium]|nr:hypothetical protein [Blastocatellia bacterium]
AIYVAILFFCVLFFGFFPSLLRRMPESLLNLPNKDYWLAAERREQTFSFLGEQMRWFGAATLMLTLLIIQLVINANLAPTQYLSARTAWLLLAAYLIYVGLWLIRFWMRFRKTAT